MKIQANGGDTAVRRTTSVHATVAATTPPVNSVAQSTELKYLSKSKSKKQNFYLSKSKSNWHESYLSKSKKVLLKKLLFK